MKSILRQILTAVFAAAFLAQPGTALAEKYAVLAAIDDYSNVGASNLPGCSTDLKGMQELLTGKLGFPAAHVTSLVNAQATRAGILRALDAMVEKAQPGDSVIFYFSGHGGQVPDFDDDEDEDGLDEALITHDFNPRQQATWLLDDHLGASLSRLKTQKALVLIDACHSGTGTRSDLVNKRADFGFKSMMGLVRQDKNQFRLVKNSQDSHTLIASCEANQVSAMGTYDGVKRSLYTTALLNVMPNMMSAPLPDFRSALYREMERLHASAAAEQHPTLEGNISVTLNVIIGAEPGSGELNQPNNNLPQPAPVDGLPSAFPVALTAQKEEFRPEDELVATVVSQRAGYLRLYFVDKTGEATLIFPNYYQQDNRITTGQRIEVGGQGSSFLFRVKPPQGTELLLAAVAEQQFTDHDALNFSKEQPVKSMGKVNSIRKLVDSGVKDLGVEARVQTGGGAPVRPAQIGRAAFIYHIR